MSGEGAQQAGRPIPVVGLRLLCKDVTEMSPMLQSSSNICRCVCMVMTCVDSGGMNV